MRIGIVGPMGSGKTTVAEILQDEYDLRRESLATPVKAIADGMEEYENLQDRLRFLQEWALRLLPDPIYRDKNPRLALDEGNPLQGMTTQDLLVGSWEKAYEESQDKRELYQRVGTDCGRAFNPWIWIHYFTRHLRDGKVVVDDVRFLNEAYALHNLGFQLVRIDTPDENRIKRLIDRDGAETQARAEERMEHPSEVEQAQIKCDYTLYNDGDLYDLDDEVEQLVDYMFSVI